MVAKKSKRNQRKDAKALASQIGSKKKVKDMSLQERKQNVLQNLEQIKGKLTLMMEGVKDNTKGFLGLLAKELIAAEETIEAKTNENKKLKKLLTAHKIKF